MENQNGEVTNDELARMIGEGFHGVDEKIGGIDRKLESMRSEFNERFDTIEKFLLEDHRRRIGKLEEKVHKLEDLLAIK